MRSIKLILVILLISSANVWAFTFSADSTAAKKDTIKYNYFSTGANYGSNSLFFGRAPIVRTPYLSNDISYKLHSGFWVSTSFYNILNSTSLIDNFDLSAGWDKRFKDKYDISTSYSRFFFPQENMLVESTTSNFADVYFGADLKHIYTSLGVASIFGQTNDVFLLLSNSRYFCKEGFLKTKGTLAIEPRITIAAGTQNFMGAYEEKVTDYYMGSPVDIPVTGRKGPGNAGPDNNPATGTTNTVKGSGFNILSYELSIPLTYTIGKFSFEGTWKYVLPVNVPNQSTVKGQSVFLLSFYYILKHRVK